MSVEAHKMPNGPCWEWPKARNRGGYGVMRRGGTLVYAHRWMYEQFNGEIPEGLQIDHLCRNRACVNPDHLEPVTHAENGRRGAATKLNADQVRHIRKSNLPAIQLARAYDLSPEYVEKLRAGKRWVGV